MISEYNLNTKLTPFDMNVKSRGHIWDIWYINVVVLKGFIIDGCVSQQTLIDFYIFILTSTALMQFPSLTKYKTLFIISGGGFCFN